MNIERFEKKLAEKFGRFSPKYKATEDMWDAIESELRPKKKSSRSIFPFFLFFGFLGMVFCYHTFSDGTEIVKSSEEMLGTYLSQTEKESMEQKRLGTFVGHEIQKTQDAKEAILLASNPSLSESLVKDEISKVEEQAKPIQKLIAKTEAQIIRAKTAKEPSDVLKKFFAERQSRNSGVGFIIPQLMDKQGSALVLDRVEEQVVEESSKRVLTALNPLPVSEFDLVLDALVLPVLKSGNTFTENTVESSKNHQRFSLGLAFGINQLSSKYVLNDPAYANVLENRKRSEQADLQYLIGLQLEYDLLNKWSIQSGINYQYFQDESYTLSATVHMDTIENYAMNATTALGGDTTILGRAIIRNDSSFSSRTYTNRHIVSIPILITYNMRLSEKSKMGIGLGFEKTIFTQIEGMEADLNATTYDLTLDKESRYGSKGAYALFQLMYKYKLTNNWDLRLASNYRRALSSNYNASAPIQKSFHAINLSVSTHLKF